MKLAGALAHGRLRPAAGDERERARDEQGQGAGADGHRSPMLSHPMTKARRLVLIAISLAATAGGVSACGEQGISSSLTGEDREAAEHLRRALLGLPHAHRGRHRGFDHERPDPRVQGRPELRPAQGDRELRAVRDPQRRLLLRPDAAGHRRRRGRRAARRASWPSTRAPTSRPSPARPRAPPTAPRGSGCSTSGPSPAILSRCGPRLARRRDGSDERLMQALACAQAPERGAAGARGAAGQAQRRREGDRRGQAHRRGRLGGDRRDAGRERAGQGARARGDAARGRARGARTPRSRTRPTRPRPTRTRRSASGASSAPRARTTSSSPAP